jgi:hypothetical protein
MATTVSLSGLRADGVFAATDWSAISAVAGIVAVVLVVGGAVSRSTRNYFGTRRREVTRLDKLEVRLWGMPADPGSGARKVDGEFDRIYGAFDVVNGRLDELPEQILDKLKKAQ